MKKMRAGQMEGLKDVRAPPFLVKNKKFAFRFLCCPTKTCADFPKI